MVNETFGSIKVFNLTSANQTGRSIFQITNLFGHAQFTKYMNCTSLLLEEFSSESGSITNLQTTTASVQELNINDRIIISILPGFLTGPYINFSRLANIGYYLYDMQGSLAFQKTTGLIPIGDLDTVQTIDTITNISGWQNMLAPSGVVPEATVDLSELIISVNALLRIFADRGILITTEIPQPTEITEIIVDVSGFYVNWTGPHGPLKINEIMYDSSASAPYFVPITAPNTFYYSLTVGPSLPFLAAFCNINSKPRDMANFNPTFGLTPSTRAYYRATDLNKINYILLSTASSVLTENTVFFLEGSNASPTTPIGFIYYSQTIYGSAYVPANITLIDPDFHILIYNYGLDLWTLHS